MATKKSNKSAAAWLVFIGSIAFLYVFYSWMTNGLFVGGWLLGYAEAWTPIAAGLALISSIALFFMGLAAIMGKADERAWAGISTSTWWGGFSLFILTAGTQWLWVAIIGFLFLYLGTNWSRWM